MSRKLARESSMKLLFEINYKMGESESVLEEFFLDNKLDDKDSDYIKDTVHGTLNHLQDIDSTIEKYSKGWKVARLAKVDLAILRLALYEILYSDVPDSVAINEAVELAKKYGSDRSGAFINGILASAAKER